MSEQVESGTIVIGLRLSTQIRGALRTWTNRMHRAVMFEVGRLSEGLGSDGAALDLLAERIAAEPVEGSEQIVLVRRLARRAAAEHVERCRATSGRLRAPGVDVLDELLPLRTLADEYFRVPDVHGCVPAGITVERSALHWYARATDDASAADARSAPLARIAFGALRKAAFRAGEGGEIVDGSGRVVLRCR